MTTDDKLNQITEILTYLKEGQQRLEHGQQQLEKGQDELRGQVSSLQKGQILQEERANGMEVLLQVHVQQSKKEHSDILSLMLDTTEENDKAYKKKLSNHEERILTVEKQISSS